MFYTKKFYIREHAIDIVFDEAARLSALLFNTSSITTYLHPLPTHGTIYQSYQDITKKIQKYLAGKIRHVLSHDEVTACIARSNTSVFEKKVWNSLLKIPYGTVTTYGRIAHLLGVPRAARAIGNALAKNTLPILVPCHRVVLQCNYNKKNHSARDVKNYAGGITMKKILLHREGALLTI